MVNVGKYTIHGCYGIVDQSCYPRFLGHQTCSLTISNKQIHETTRQVSSFQLEVGIFQNQGKPRQELHVLMYQTHVLGVSKHLLLKHIHIIFNMVDYLESNLKTDTILWWALEKGTCSFTHDWLFSGTSQNYMWPPKKSKAFLLKPTPQKELFLLGLVSSHIFLRYRYAPWESKQLPRIGFFGFQSHPQNRNIGKIHET